MAKLTTCIAEMRDKGHVALNRKDIEDIVPHRGSALLADSIFRFEDRMYGTWLPEMARFEGHFYRQPVLPAHYLMESGAILGLCAAVRHFRGDDSNEYIYKKAEVFASTMSVQMKKPVMPGKEVFFAFEDFGEPKHIRGLIFFIGKISAWVDGELVGIIEVSGTVKFV
ncbi:MAG: hypothetical protein WCI57_00440 [Candidatus Berkelbacteria bacterium]